MNETAETLIGRYIRDGSKAHYALLLTPAGERLYAAAALAFDAQMRALCATSRDVAPAKLHWWHEEIERLRNGAPRHPITQSLATQASDELVDRLNDRLHGAVVDFNAAQIDDNDLDRYLHMRSGALFATLALAAGKQATARDTAAGTVCAVGDLLHEARDPAFAATPAAHLGTLIAIAGKNVASSDADLAIEAILSVRREQALDALADASTGSVTGSILLALYKQDWPRIIAAPRGTTPPSSTPWSRLWIAWRAARRHQP